MHPIGGILTAGMSLGSPNNKDVQEGGGFTWNA
jgi:hypothetical protein